MLTRPSTIRKFLKSASSHNNDTILTNYSLLSTHRNLYYFQKDPDTQIFDKYLQSKETQLKNYTIQNQQFQRVIVPRFQPSVQQIKRKLQTQWKNKKLVFNIDPSALIGSKRFYMKEHLEKNVYKGLSKPESFFSQINPSAEISTQELKFDEQHFLFSDPIANKVVQQNPGLSQQQQEQLVQQAIITAYQNDPERFVNRLKTTLNVPEAYQKIIQLGMHNQNPIYFCGFNQYSFRSLLSKFLNLTQVKQLFMLSLKYAQTQSYRSKLTNKSPFKGNFQECYQSYARELVYLNHFNIIKKIENGEIMKRLRFIMKEKQDSYGEKQTKSRRISSFKKRNNLVLFGHSYTIQTLNEYTIIKDLQSPTMQNTSATITPQTFNSPAPLKSPKVQQTQSDSDKIQKHAILETMLGNLWNQPYSLNKFSYLSQDYTKLNQQDKQQVKNLYHDCLTRYTGAKKIWYETKINYLQKIDANSQQFKEMKQNFDLKRQQQERNKQLIKKKLQQKEKLKQEKQDLEKMYQTKKRIKKQQVQKQAYSQYPQKYQQDQQELKRLNIVKNPKKQEIVQQKIKVNQIKANAASQVIQQNQIQQKFRTSGRRTKPKKTASKTQN